MWRRSVLVWVLAACGSDRPPDDVTCRPALVYLNRDGGTFAHGGHDDAVNRLSVLVDTTRTLAPWPHGESEWQELVGCVETALAPFPRLEITELDPGAQPRIELVFTTTYWNDPPGTTMIVPSGCSAGHHVEFLFGNALPTTARACHLAMKGFAQMTAKLSLGDNCHDFVNDELDCSPDRAFLDETATCVDAASQPAPCRCGGTEQNTFRALASAFPTCP